MSLKKSVSTLMIVSQLGLVSLASAATPAAHTAEYGLLQHVLALQGQDLSSDQNQKQVTEVVSQYLATASQAGQQERLQAALVDLGVYTPNEAASFVTESQQAGLKVAASTSASATLETEITQLANLHPMGAQFSACGVGGTMMLLGSIGFLVAVAGPHYANDSQLCFGTPCYQQGYEHSDSFRNGEMISFGVVAAVGAILYFASGSCSS